MHGLRLPAGRTSAAAVLLLACLATFPDTGAVVKNPVTVQMEFGVKVAQKGSWNEAAFRFRKAVAGDPRNPRAYSNLAVAMESLGQFEAAREAYETAVGLAPKDEKIRQNYDRFLSFYRSLPTAQRNAAHGP